MLLNAIFRSSLIFCPNASWTYLMRTMAISASFLPSYHPQLTRTELARNASQRRYWLIVERTAVLETSETNSPIARDSSQNVNCRAQCNPPGFGSGGKMKLRSALSWVSSCLVSLSPSHQRHGMLCNSHVASRQHHSIDSFNSPVSHSLFCATTSTDTEPTKSSNGPWPTSSPRPPLLSAKQLRDPPRTIRLLVVA
jgi:hypothetical protein